MSESTVNPTPAYERTGLVMERLTGQTLQELIDGSPGGIDPPKLRSLMLGVLDALALIHGADVVHGDVTPANIFLRASGVPALLNPLPIGEIVVDDLPGPRADLHGFGSTFYQAIGGTRVDVQARIQGLVGGRADPLVPAVALGAGRYEYGLLEAIDHCLSLKVEDRPHNAAEVIALIGGPGEPSVTKKRPNTQPPTARTGASPDKSGSSRLRRALIAQFRDSDHPKTGIVALALLMETVGALLAVAAVVLQRLHPQV